MTYFDAISAWQQRSFDALKAAQSSQVASLQTALDCAAAVAARRSPMSAGPSLFSDMAALFTSFTFQVLEQQIAYVKELADTMAGPARAEPPRMAAAAPAIQAPSPPAVAMAAPDADGASTLSALPAATLVSLPVVPAELALTAGPDSSTVSVSDDFSTAGPPSDSPQAKPQPSPVSSARARAKPPKGPPSGQRPVKRGPAQ